MYIYIDDALQLNPHPPCSSVHYCSVVHYCTSVHYCQLPDLDCRLPGCRLREGFFCFGKMGYIQSAVVHPAVVRQAVIQRGRCFASSGMGLTLVKAIESFF